MAPPVVLQITSEQLQAMSDEQLRGWADDALGIVVPMNTPRTVLLTKIVNAAVAASDGLT